MRWAKFEAIASPEELRLGEALKVDANKLMKDAKQVSNSAYLARGARFTLQGWFE